MSRQRVLPSKEVDGVGSLATLVCAKSLTGLAVELGVFNMGELAATILKTSSITEMEGISPFREWNDHAYPEIEDEIALARVQRATAVNYREAGASLRVHRASQAHVDYGDGSLDLLFVNMHHGLGCLADWWPKVRVGGLIVGEGYPREMHLQVSNTEQSVYMAFPEDGPPWWMVYV